MPKKKKKRRGFPFLDFLMFGTTVGIGLAGLTRKAGGIVEPPDAPPTRPPPIRPPPTDTRIQDCINDGGTWNAQFQLCEFPEPPPARGILFPINTRIRVREGCGPESGFVGIVTAHIFQRPADRTLNDLSMVVLYDNPPPFRNAWRVSEICLELE